MSVKRQRKIRALEPGEPQSPEWQASIIQAAIGNGTLHELYWTVGIVMPLEESRGRSPMERMRNRLMTGSFYGKVPAIPLAPDPDASREYAEILVEIMRRAGWYAGETLRTYQADILSIDTLNKATWFIWGEHDLICPVCGGVVAAYDCGCVTKNKESARLLALSL